MGKRGRASPVVPRVKTKMMIYVDKEVFQGFKHRAVDEEIPMSTLVQRLMERYLKQENYGEQVS